MAVIEHPNMPKSLMDIQGLNLWNILMFSVFMAWPYRRQMEGLDWDMPRHIACLLFFYASVVGVAFVRLLFDLDSVASFEGIDDLTALSAFSDYLINTIKWMLPGVLLYDTCRSRERMKLAIAVVLGLYLLYAVQVIHAIPLGYLLDPFANLGKYAGDNIDDRVGYHRVTMSMMLAGASWAVFATVILMRKRIAKLMVLGVVGIVGIGQALTGGRTGYVTWIVVGFILCVVRWRRVLVPLVLIPVLVLSLMPGVAGRMLDGFGAKQGAQVMQRDDDRITSGRTVIWPYVIEKIAESPLTGHGRLAMQRTGLYDNLLEQLDESFPHPHNAYLQILLDGGIIGFVCVVSFFWVVILRSFRLLRDKDDPLCNAVGGVAAALVLALLVGGMGSHTFYPREGAVGMWAAIGLMLRASVEKSRLKDATGRIFEDSELPLEASPGSGETSA